MNWSEWKSDLGKVFSEKNLQNSARQRSHSENCSNSCQGAGISKQGQPVLYYESDLATILPMNLKSTCAYRNGSWVIAKVYGDLKRAVSPLEAFNWDWISLPILIFWGWAAIWWHIVDDLDDVCWMQSFLQAGMIVAGWDKYDGGSVYAVPLGGTLLRLPFATGGLDHPVSASHCVGSKFLG